MNGNESNNRSLIGRRQFLIASSVAAVASATVGPKLLAEAITPAPKKLAVGFAPAAAGAAMAAASAVSGADRAFLSRGARVTVHGARVATTDPRARRTLNLVAHYPVVEGGEVKSVPFFAWGCSRQTGSDGNCARFVMPVADTEKLVFTVTTQRGLPTGVQPTRRDALTAPTESTPTPVTLSLGGEPGSFNLAAGYYVIVPMFGGDRDPRWSAYTVGELDGESTLIGRDGKAPDFEHFVLRIDYAS